MTQQRDSRETQNSIRVKGRQYTVLELVGKGGSSKVFKVCVTCRHFG